MHASAFLARAPESALRLDFVSALSAEEACPLCSELHATVDQCACVACDTKTCPDCASLRPDASWVCARCVLTVPSLSVVPASTPVWQRLLKVRIALVQLAFIGAATLRQAARPVAAQLVMRMAVQYARLRRVARRQQRVQSARVRELVVALRSVHWRQHATSLLIATAILIAVARSQPSADGR